MLKNKIPSSHSITDLAAKSENLCAKYGVALDELTPATYDLKEIAIISTANAPWYVIKSQRVKEIFNAFRASEYYFSPKSYKLEQGNEDVIELQSVAHIVAALKRQMPFIIYLRVSPHTRSEFLVPILRTHFPNAKLIVEFYDVGLLFHGDVLYNAVGKDLDLLEDNRLGCEVAFELADKIITKNAGHLWAEWLGTAAEKTLTYFPNIDTSSYPTRNRHASSRPLNDENHSILYAGAVNNAEFEIGYGTSPGANLRAYFDAILESPEWQLHVVNAAHFSNQETKRFRIVQEAMSDPGKNVQYHMSMPHLKLMDFAKKFNFGLCCSHYEQDEVMDVTRVVIPNRVSSYWAAGLPVIIDDRFEYICDLVLKFDAGIVVEAGNFSQLTKKLKNADISRLHKGVERLVRSILSRNDCVEKTLGSLAGIQH